MTREIAEQLKEQVEKLFNPVDMPSFGGTSTRNLWCFGVMAAAEGDLFQPETSNALDKVGVVWFT